ncbi:MAG: tRNA (N6-threonylcarbamoyladenosine(37)-N6)-methyltransferase TrmO [Sinobacteraceae bacterium]|nr:tRNA (N6-threonylcarbamoyladenosine(37)-N6)-methyltransferase TrmO [Nevskiaceae bacterium]
MHRPQPPAGAQLTLEPIGYAHTALPTKVDAPRQPQAARGTPGRIELLPGRHFEHALEDLQGWEYVWVIFWFHLNPSWRPKVLPPRSTSGRKGVFSTRAPHRPNPLGLSALRLERIEGLTLHLLDVDLVDGTPVLDIKPYVPYTDAHPQARSGWLEEPAGSGRSYGSSCGAGPAAPDDPVAAFQVSFEAQPLQRIAWIESRSELALRARIEATLSMGPAPHPYRRIRAEGGAYVLAVKEWRARFVVEGRQVRVLELRSGFRHAQLATPTANEDPALALHREFVASFPG